MHAMGKLSMATVSIAFLLGWLLADCKGCSILLLIIISNLDSVRVDYYFDLPFVGFTLTFQNINKTIYIFLLPIEYY